MAEANNNTNGNLGASGSNLAGGLGGPGGLSMGGNAHAGVAEMDGPGGGGGPARSTREVRYKHGAEAQKFGWWWGTGRRKTAIARVRIRPGNGVFLVNERKIDEYFTEPRDRSDVVAPLNVTGTLGRMDVYVKCHGGGFMGQAQAIRLGVSRALRVYDSGFEDVLRENGFLTRDSREVERKKPGQAGARRRFQFSKR